MDCFKCRKIGLFRWSPTGTAGVKVLAGKDAKKFYINRPIRVKGNCVMIIATSIQEKC